MQYVRARLKEYETEIRGILDVLEKQNRGEKHEKIYHVILGSYYACIYSAAGCDVQFDMWFNNAISTLNNAGILEGYSDRRGISAIIVRIMGFCHANGTGGIFEDTAGHWAAGYINTAQGLGWA